MSIPLTTFRAQSGEEFVVITRAEYDRLMSEAEFAKHMEDVGTARILKESAAAIARGDDIAVPEMVWDAIEGGENRVSAFRKWRGLTQAQLAAATGISQSYISQIEGGQEPPLERLRDIATALKVPLSLLVVD